MSEETVRTAPDNPEWVKAVCADEPLLRPLRITDESKTNAAPVDADAGAKRVGLWLCAGTVSVAVLMVVAFAAFGGGPEPIPTRRVVAVASAVSAGPTTNAPPAPVDAAVPFTAATASCGPGSTSPQALADASTDSAWVCTRGPQESLVDGQVLHVSFTCGQARPACSYMVSSVSVTPGWLAKTVGGKDQWLAHRVVTRLQFNFFNGAALAADPFFVDTNSVHGPVTATLPARVLASHVDVLVLHTDRPPAAPLPSASPDGATATDIPAPSETSDDPSTLADPVDATFAMSQLQFFGHAPN
jgi:hypothetical protein